MEKTRRPNGQPWSLDLNLKHNQRMGITKVSGGFNINTDLGSLTYSTEEKAAESLIRQGYNADLFFNREGDHQT
jgi:hypothetical protein